MSSIRSKKHKLLKKILTAFYCGISKVKIKDERFRNSKKLRLNFNEILVRKLLLLCFGLLNLLNPDFAEIT